ncbi:MAG: hypothetical protein ABJD11_00160 [Gemmatimonadota bacterium]
MNRLTVLLLLVLLPAASLCAQTVVTPEPQLDATRIRARDALLVLRDSLASVTAAAAWMERDLASSSDQAARGWATRVSDACARSSRTLAGTQGVVIQLNVPSPDPGKQRPALTAALTTLHAELEKCVAQFKEYSASPNTADLRSYAVPEGLKVAARIHKYESTLDRYFAAADIHVRPLGVPQGAKAR